MRAKQRKQPKAMEANVKKGGLLFDLYQMEDDEEADLYLLDLYLNYRSDLDVFTLDERKEIFKIINHLKKETEKHGALLKEVINELETAGKESPFSE